MVVTFLVEIIMSIPLLSELLPRIVDHLWYSPDKKSEAVDIDQIETEHQIWINSINQRCIDETPLGTPIEAATTEDDEDDDEDDDDEDDNDDDDNEEEEESEGNHDNDTDQVIERVHLRRAMIQPTHRLGRYSRLAVQSEEDSTV